MSTFARIALVRCRHISLTPLGGFGYKTASQGAMLERTVDQIFLSCTALTLQVAVQVLKLIRRPAPSVARPSPGVALQH